LISDSGTVTWNYTSSANRWPRLGATALKD